MKMKTKKHNGMKEKQFFFFFTEQANIWLQHSNQN